MKKVSCLCITQPGREAFLAESIACFEAQDYAEKELIIVNDRKDGRTLGDLRNESLDRATGDYVAIWDDDDLSLPKRLSRQIKALEVADSDAVFLHCLIFRCVCGHECPTELRDEATPWENTMVAVRETLFRHNIRYPSLDKREDTAFTAAMVAAKLRMSLVYDASLYVYRFHGQNTWDARHWDELTRFTRSPHRPSECVASAATP